MTASNPLPHQVTPAVTTTARGVLVESSGERIIFGVLGTDYRIHLRTAAPLDSEPGDRIRGKITVHARRIDRCHTGGNYIDPIYGEPRIVQGRILAIDSDAGAIVVRAAVPVMAKVRAPQKPSDFLVGDLVTFGVDSGATFEPAGAES